MGRQATTPTAPLASTHYKTGLQSLHRHNTGRNFMTPEQIKDLSPEGRTATFHRLACEWYGTDRYGNLACDDLGITRSTVFAWKRENTVPAWAIEILALRLERRAASQLFDQIKALSARLP